LSAKRRPKFQSRSSTSLILPSPIGLADSSGPTTSRSNPNACQALRNLILHPLDNWALSCSFPHAKENEFQLSAQDRIANCIGRPVGPVFFTSLGSRRSCCLPLQFGFGTLGSRRDASLRRVLNIVPTSMAGYASRTGNNAVMDHAMKPSAIESASGSSKTLAIHAFISPYNRDIAIFRSLRLFLAAFGMIPRTRANTTLWKGLQLIEDAGAGASSSSSGAVTSHSDLLAKAGMLAAGLRRTLGVPPSHPVVDRSLHEMG